MKLSKIFPAARSNVLSYEPSDLFSLPSCIVGIEIEVENCPLTASFVNEFALHEASGYWEHKSDGSLRNNGIEFVSSKLFGKDIIDGLHYLFEFFEILKDKLQRTVEVSHRCGLHIHVDVGDLSVNEFMNLVGLNLFLEETLIKITGGRSSNSFCIPIEHNPEIFKLLVDLHSEDGNPDDGMQITINNVISNYQKYSAINYAPVYRQGSIEYRMHEATLDLDKILSWIQMLINIKKYSKDITIGRKELPDFISGYGPSAYIQEILRKDIPVELFEDYDEILLRGLRLMQDFFILKNVNPPANILNENIDIFQITKETNAVYLANSLREEERQGKLSYAYSSFVRRFTHSNEHEDVEEEEEYYDEEEENFDAPPVQEYVNPIEGPATRGPRYRHRE